MATVRRGLATTGVLAFLTLGGAVTATPECLTSAGKTACGFHCVASDGDVRCSQSQDGVCSVTSGVVTCWDPPPMLRRALGDRLSKASCSTTSGQTACGFSCQTNSDHVSCAQTPFGACAATDGKLACWDPPAAVIVTLRSATPVTECITSSGKIACGYHCQTYDGVARCSQTPQGTCIVDRGHLVCWDPPLDSFATPYDPDSELACLEGADGRSCGYRCLATTLHSTCGTARDQTCRTVADAITCKAPE